MLSLKWIGNILNLPLSQDNMGSGARHEHGPAGARSHLHKEQIEKWVADITNTAIITPKNQHIIPKMVIESPLGTIEPQHAALKLSALPSVQNWNQIGCGIRMTTVIRFQNKMRVCGYKLLNAGEGPPTLQSTVIPAWNYAPQLLGKVTPTFSPVVERSTNMKKHTKNIIPNVQNTMRTQVTPMVSNYGKLSTKWHVSISKRHVNAWFMYVWAKYFLLQNECKRMIHVCLGKMFLLQNASNSNVQSITSTSKKCHLSVQNTMWTHDSSKFMYVLVCFGNKSRGFWFTYQLNISATGPERGQKRGSKRGQKIALETPQL